MVSKGDQRRQRILEVVGDLLFTHTFEQVTVAEITRRADVTRPGFYFYFPTKGSAVASLMEGLYAEFEDVARVWYDHRLDNQPQALADGMSATVQLWRKHAPVMHAMAQASAGDPYASEIQERWISAFVARAVPTIAADTGSNVKRLGSSIESLARALVDATFAAMRRDVSALLRTGEPPSDTVETLVLLWTRVLYPGQRPPGPRARNVRQS
jgi:AcrR family transcriptional regulator